ncbi:MAG: GGDEF domain-containing protein [Vampirovibrionales bacterium]|nr:GGDEF domain-containing protein [Vampirovibrionales bacterium]
MALSSLRFGAQPQAFPATRDSGARSGDSFGGITAPRALLAPRFGQDRDPLAALPESRNFRRSNPLDQLAKLELIFKMLISLLERCEKRIPIAAPILSQAHNLLDLGMGTVQNLRNLVGRDALTGVPNRQSYDDALKQRSDEAKARQGDFTTLMLDIDHFKKVNDTLGHEGGDRVLRQVAESVQRYLENQKGDPQVFRYGGEEFAILASGLTRDESQALAQGVCNAVRAIDWEGERRSDYKLNEAGLDYIRNQRDHGAMTVSVGACHAQFSNPDDIQTFEKPEVLTKAADSRLYFAKKSGRNRACL